MEPTTRTARLPHVSPQEECVVEPLAELIGFIDIGSLSDDLLLELLVRPYSPIVVCDGMRNVLPLALVPYDRYSG